MQDTLDIMDLTHKNEFSSRTEMPKKFFFLWKIVNVLEIFFNCKIISEEGEFYVFHQNLLPKGVFFTQVNFTLEVNDL